MAQAFSIFQNFQIMSHATDNYIVGAGLPWLPMPQHRRHDSTGRKRILPPLTSLPSPASTH